jgi:[acyl-carrier-protein] S-malonyltransferase
MKRAFTFPGQGSQVVGMGKALAEASQVAADVFKEVDEALGQNLSGLMFEGPLEDLTLTENTQPALMAVSVAVVRMIEANGCALADHASYVAGHSLGEYSALAASGALSLPDTAKLLKVRGQAMQKAVPVGEGAMAALLGLDFEAAQKVASDAAGDGVCATANDNAVGQVVLSGDKAAIDRACILAKDAGAKRAMPLSVSAPFHCALMQPAADAMAEALAEAKLTRPSVPLVANVTAEAVSDVSTIPGLLVAQVTGMVRWRESVQWMASQGVEQMVELGSGKILTGMVKRIDKTLASIAIQSPQDIDAFCAELKG